jgi:hypothetical protein
MQGGRRIDSALTSEVPGLALPLQNPMTLAAATTLRRLLMLVEADELGATTNHPLVVPCES